jgi:hypothetical protein
MKHTPHSNPNLIFLLYRIFSSLQEKESISGQNLIDNLLNFGLIKNPFTKKFNSTTCRLEPCYFTLIQYLWPLKTA